MECFFFFLFILIEGLCGSWVIYIVIFMCVIFDLILVGKLRFFYIVIFIFVFGFGFFVGIFVFGYVVILLGYEFLMVVLFGVVLVVFVCICFILESILNL